MMYIYKRSVCIYTSAMLSILGASGSDPIILVRYELYTGSVYLM